MKSRLHSIDCLRALAAVAVCVGHGIVSARWAAIPARWFQMVCLTLTPIGALGVPLFFVISGFCIHMTYAKGLRDSGGAWPEFRFSAFWKRRLWRLYPTYFIVLCASMLLLAALYARNPAMTAATRYPEPKPLWMAWDFLAHAAMVHGFFPMFDQGGGNPPFWTLAREEYLYALYPLFLMGRRSVGVWASVGAVFVVGALPQFGGAVMTSGPWAVVTSSVLPTWIQWTLGAVAAEAYCGTIRLPWFCRSLWAVPLWAVAAEMYHPLYLALYGMAFFTLINWCVAWETCHRRPVRGTMRAVAGIGTMSYSLYLVHVPVQDVMMGVSSRIGAFDTPAMYLFRVTVLVAASLAVARALFVLVESRFLFAGRPSSIPDQDCPSVSRGPVRAKVECRRGIQ